MSCSLVTFLDVFAFRLVTGFGCCADMRADVQDIFKQTPHDKQVMMFSATLSQEIRPICKKFMTDVCPFSAMACGLPAWRPLSMASLSPPVAVRSF